MSAEQKARQAKKALLLLFAVNLLNFFDRQLPGVLGEPIRKEFGLTDAQLGMLGTAFTLKLPVAKPEPVAAPLPIPKLGIPTSDANATH